MNKSSKGIAPVLIAIIIGLVTVSSYIFFKKNTSPSQLDTATSPPKHPATEWSLYTNEEGKYQVSYPSSWRAQKGNPTQLYSYSAEDTNNGHFDPILDKDKVKIEIWTNSQEFDTLESFVEEREREEKLSGGKLSTDYLPITVGNQEGLKKIETLGGDFRILVIYLQNPITKLFHTMAVYPRYDISQNIVDQILSTFEFLE